MKHKGLAALKQKGEALKAKGEGIAMKLATATKAAATSTTTRPRGEGEEGILAGDDEEGEGAKTLPPEAPRLPVPEDGEHDSARRRRFNGRHRARRRRTAEGRAEAARGGGAARGVAARQARGGGLEENIAAELRGCKIMMRRSSSKICKRKYTSRG